MVLFLGCAAILTSDYYYRRGKKQGLPSAIQREARSTLFDLPLLDELRTYCYEHMIEELPAFLAV